MHLGRLPDVVIISLGQCEVADAPRSGGGAGYKPKYSSPQIGISDESENIVYLVPLYSGACNMIK